MTEKTSEQIIADISAQARVVNAERDKLRGMIDATPKELHSVPVEEHVVCAAGCGCHMLNAADLEAEFMGRLN